MRDPRAKLPSPIPPVKSILGTMSLDETCSIYHDDLLEVGLKDDLHSGTKPVRAALCEAARVKIHVSTSSTRSTLVHMFKASQ